MKKICFLMSIFLCLGACTPPSQRIASDSLQRGISHGHSIITDLANMAKQSTVNQGVAEARAAVLTANEQAAQDAVQNTVSQWDKISWLQIQWERARGLMRVGQQFVWTQKGIFNLIVDEFKEAKARRDAKWADGQKQDSATKTVSHEDIDKASG